MQHSKPMIILGVFSLNIGSLFCYQMLAMWSFSHALVSLVGVLVSSVSHFGVWLSQFIATINGLSTLATNFKVIFKLLTLSIVLLIFWLFTFHYNLSILFLITRLFALDFSVIRL